MTRAIDEALLDDVDALEAADGLSALRTLAGSGAQVRAAAAAADEAGVPGLAREERPRAVVVASVGASAVVADVLSALAGPGSPVPVLPRCSDTLPGWVGPLDLVVAVSLSGGARGPVALAAEAKRRGCGLLTVGAARSPLADVCAQARGVHVPVTMGTRSSRLALWTLATPVLMAAGALGLIDLPPRALEETADRLDAVAETSRPSSETFVNPAKALATALAGSIPLVLGNGDLAGVAATRAAGALMRNARHPAVLGTLPDDASALVATFDGPFAGSEDDLFADPFVDGESGARLRLLLLRDAEEDADLRRTGNGVRETAEGSGVLVSELVAEGAHPLERLASLVGLTDYASVYLALGLGYDPLRSAHVADLKDRL